MKKLIIAEKPSVARNIADALGIKGRKNGYMEGEKYVITWVFGHLLQLYDVKDYDETRKSWRMENFPFIPETFRYKIKSDPRNKNKVDEGAEKQIGIIKSLMERDDVEGVVSATDYDREGQIIADEIFLYTETSKQVERLLLNEWTKDEVLAGLQRLCPNSDLKPMQDAGFGRQLADWLIGINLTSVATVKYRNANHDQVLNIGRVLLPTLKIIYNRDKEIESFQKSKYYKLIAPFLTEEGEIIEALYMEKDSEKFEDQSYLETILDKMKGQKGLITEKEVERKKEYAPYLFNLSNLQGFITSKFKGWTSEKVLKTAQDLYEKKIITYPRTASSVLDESLKEKAAKVLQAVKRGMPYEEEIKFSDSKRIFDSKKVESHSAIIPTYVLPKNLTPDEQIVYEAVRNRFLAQFLPVSESEETRLVIRAEGAELPGTFTAKGKVQLVEGWKKAESVSTKEIMMPPLEKGALLQAGELAVKEVVRKPPKHHTEKTLLRVMETCGKSFEEEDSEEMMMAILSGFSIGTPATRAETIRKLKDVGYITTKGKSLLCTQLGRMMVETFPVKELFDLEYTGRLEKTLSDIEKNKFQQQEFLEMIKEFTAKSVEAIKGDKVFASKVSLPDTVEVLGMCPECGNPVIESEKAYGCSNWKNGCRYAIWKDDKFIESLGKKVSPEMVRLLLQNGRVGFHGLQSKKGNRFSAYLHYEKDPQKGFYSWKLEFID
ncbi:MAG: DNA topoisomerase [Clostridiales Family XIII bacterium]|nr:DNA topoisomerase [Clostridia bacterium]MDE8733045.1 DNA topoisomerase [Eubacteriales bacterium DFI.9.88]MDY3012148.1 DNA topoisomerase [Clostridiales Family XIII bacterium]